MKKIDIENWNRKDLYYNFLHFEDPFFNICADVDVGKLKSFTKDHNESFFLTSYYLVLKVANSLEAFKLRIRRDEVIMHGQIGGSCPIMKADNTFGFGYFTYFDTYAAFKEDASQVIQAIQEGGSFKARYDTDNLIHSSVIPWISFKSFEHAKRLKQGDSVPKIVMGKLYQQQDKWLMPVSVSGHHALMDGLHVGQFFQSFQQVLNQPEDVLVE